MHEHSNFHIDEIIKRKKELKELYLSLLLRSFAISMISIFVPVYLLIEGFSLPDVLIFYIILNIATIILSPLTAILTSKIGVKHTLFISAPITILYFGLLHFLTEFNIPLYALAITGALAVALYWIPIHSDFARSGDKKHRGSQSATFILIPRMADIVAPLAGAIIVETYSFSILFAIISLITIGAMIPPLRSSDYKSKISWDWKKFSKKKIKLSSFMFYNGFISEILKVVFPIFIFYNLGNLVALGELGSIFAVGTFIVTIAIGKYSDRFGKKLLIKMAGIVFFLGLLLAVSANNMYSLTIVAIILGLGSSMLKVPLFALETNEARKHPTEFMALREMIIRLGMATAAFILLITGDMSLIFLCGAIASGFIILKKI
jgi:MFS family permease